MDQKPQRDKKTPAEWGGQIIAWAIILAFPLLFAFVLIRALVMIILGVPADDPY